MAGLSTLNSNDYKYETVESAETSDTLDRGQAVKLSTDGETPKVVAVNAATDIVHGFVSDIGGIAAGKLGTIIRVGNGAYGIAGGTIAVGNALKLDASGHLVATTTSDDKCVGYAKDSASDNDLFAFEFTRFVL